MLNIQDFVQTQMAVMKTIVENGDFPIPVAFAIDKDENLTIMGLDSEFLRDDETKDELEKLLLDTAEKNLCVVFIAIAWTKRADGRKYTSLKNDPDRKECIVAQILLPGGKAQGAIWHFDRDNNGKAVFKSQLSFTDKVKEVQGRFRNKGELAHA